MASENTIEFHDGPLTFDQWLAAVDKQVDKITGGVGFGRDDFRDWGYAEAFEDGTEPRQAAIDALAEDVMGADFLAAAGLQGEVSF